MTLRIGFLVSHPIQYYVPIFRELARHCDLTVYYAHRQTAEQQARAGFGVAFDWDVDLMSGYRSRFLENVASQPSVERFRGCDTPGIAREIAEGGFDGFVVPGWALLCYWQAMHACRRAGTPVLVRGDSQLAGPRRIALRAAKAVIFPHLLRRFDGYFYVGQRNREYLQHYGAPADRLFFSPHCVDNDAFRSASDVARRQHACAPGRRRLLFAGKLVERKRPMDLLRAAALVRGYVDVEVAFAGSGDLEPLLRQTATETGVQAVFHGFVNQTALPVIYSKADVLVLPSELETWGLVVNEAMACGVPAVVSNVVGCGPDLIESGVTGATFPLGDAAALARAIEMVLSLDRRRTTERLAERMSIYSPNRAAQGIIDAVAALAARSQRSSISP